MLALDAVRAVLYGGDAGRINHVMTLFQETFEAVQQHVETSGTYTTEEEAARFRQLEILHRKTLRTIMDKMNRIQGDIMVIEDAQSRLHRTAALV